MSSSYFKIKQIVCQLLRRATCSYRLGTYVWKDVARESERDFERANISYGEIALKERQPDGQLLGVNSGGLGSNKLVGWCDVGRCLWARGDVTQDLDELGRVAGHCSGPDIDWKFSQLRHVEAQAVP
jgi:hypothetical protein